MREITFDGRLTKDSEVLVSKSGVKYVMLNVANDEYSEKDANGNQIVTYFKVVSFSQTHIAMSEKGKFKKGSAIYVVGQMSAPTAYIDKNNMAKVNNISVTADRIGYAMYSKSDDAKNVNTQVAGNMAQQPTAPQMTHLQQPVQQFSAPQSMPQFVVPQQSAPVVNEGMSDTTRQAIESYKQSNPNIIPQATLDAMNTEASLPF